MKSEPWTIMFELWQQSCISRGKHLEPTPRVMVMANKGQGARGELSPMKQSHSLLVRKKPENPEYPMRELPGYHASPRTGRAANPLAVSLRCSLKPAVELPINDDCGPDRLIPVQIVACSSSAIGLVAHMPQSRH